MSLTVKSAGAQSGSGVVVVTFEIPRTPGRDAIATLLGDMRMLGLQPAIVSSA